ncbi:MULTISPECIES: polyprenyl diphosphate synthase [Nitrincola]|uniref:Ditrans,polycis-undecaprenyl-diphosphate synthase ((2E,6E)-farnesyl-diphosphate specific) n=1 Tax=Nitrincola nitratireducens TaxID=1229521 RepID=W9VNI5_9GAMM|nr:MULTISPECIES: polyprenyl diphosphate synthase [Nitrincola]EXJ12045.1 Undecaprenyl pyrophosphate synthase [Nitrincola nitratireducens]
MSNQMTLTSIPNTSIPRHIAIIMDGNNRWAKQHRLPGLAGHKAGVASVRSVIEGCLEEGVSVLTLFAFSSENWKRPEPEVRGLMDLFFISLNREVKKLNKHGIRLNIIGDRSRFSMKLQEKMKAAEVLTENNSKLILNVAANYGGRWDITNAAKLIAQRCLESQMTPSDINETTFHDFTSLANFPDPDLCIRTGGEKRISNFLIWQMAYAELYFSDSYWPDFDKHQLSSAIKDYSQRQRRFGKTGEQIEANHIA